MALVRCEECSREISDRAFSCPQCGFPRRARSSMSRALKVLIALALLVLVVMFGLMMVAAWMSSRGPIEIHLDEITPPPASLPPQ